MKNFLKLFLIAALLFANPAYAASENRSTQQTGFDDDFVDGVAGGVTAAKLRNNLKDVSDSSFNLTTDDSDDITEGSTKKFLTTGSVVNAQVNASAAIDATKLIDGSISNTELGYINTLSSNAQTQISAKQDGDTDLTCLASNSSNGIFVRTGSGTCAVRTDTAGNNGITITNGDGVSGNPTFTPTTWTTVLTSDAASNSTATGVEITGIQASSLVAGTYVFRYYVIYAQGATTTGVQFGVNYTGTATAFVVNMSYAATGTTASTGDATQVASGATGNVGETFAARSESTTSPNLGSTVGVDSTGNMLAIIEGVMVVSDGGDLELWHASETTAASTVKAGTSLILTRTN